MNWPKSLVFLNRRFPPLRTTESGWALSEPRCLPGLYTAIRRCWYFLVGMLNKSPLHNMALKSFAPRVAHLDRLTHSAGEDPRHRPRLRLPERMGYHHEAAERHWDIAFELFGRKLR